MTLHEAIRQVLSEHGGALTSEEIHRQIRDRRLYTKGDKTPPDHSQVLMRVKNYPREFEIIVRLRH